MLQQINIHGFKVTRFVPDIPPQPLPELSKIKEDRDPAYDRLNARKRERRFAKQLAEFREKTK